jgi:catechol 2,3-dioxygenase-like lactoylglutathione lyase family enzyme
VIQHVQLEVSSLERSAAFYDALFHPLGWRRLHDREEAVAWGLDDPVFWIRARSEPRPGFGHICFTASGIVAVKAAWEAGIETGGTSDGGPGQRSQYGPAYYAAYLLDPDGYRIEVAVAHK